MTHVWRMPGGAVAGYVRDRSNVGDLLTFSQIVFSTQERAEKPKSPVFRRL